MKPLKHAENRLIVLRADPNAIVGHGKEPFSITFLSGKMNNGRLLSVVLDRVPREILEELHKTRFVAVDGPAGSGKTTFAARFANALRATNSPPAVGPTFASGIWLAPGPGLSPLCC